MQTVSYTSSSLHETERLGKTLALSLQKAPIPFIVFLEGPLGSGKTTLIKTIISELASIRKEAIASPTFQYVSLYKGRELPIAHFDLWRIPSCDSFFSLGLDDIVSSSLSFIEWPEKIQEAQLQASLIIRIQTPHPDERLFEIENRSDIFSLGVL